jgi:hypothetical protein
MTAIIVSELKNAGRALRASPESEEELPSTGTLPTRAVEVGDWSSRTESDSREVEEKFDCLFFKPVPK